MSNELELVDDRQGAALPVVQQNNQVRTTGSTPADLVRYAMESGADLDRLERLMQMQTEWEKREAQKLFTEAMSAFKAEDIVVTKDRHNKHFDSRYSSIGNLVGTVTPFLSKHGLSADWDLEDGQNIKVTCTITHRGGGFKSVSFSGPPDTSGSKNVIQQRKSTVTYLKSVTFESVCGIATTDANLDDDGNGSSEPVKEKPRQKEKLVGPRFDQALAAVRAGKYDAAEMRGYYALTPDQETALSDLEQEMRK